MAVLGSDTTARADLSIGFALAIASAASFGLSGALARGLLDAGWSAGAVVLVRIALGALVVAPIAGLAVGALGLAAVGAVGILPMQANTDSPVYADSAVSWWLPLLGLGVVTAGIAYCTGIAASRRLGSRLASFVALLEVVAGVGFAWFLLDQLPGPLQLAGGVLIVAGVIVVKLGERPRAPDRRRSGRRAIGQVQSEAT